MNILILGDIVSKLGRKSFEENLKRLKREKTINFIIVNGENTSHGKGLNESHYKWYMSLGVNVITMGNHTYQNKQIFNYIDNVNNIVRPFNYSADLPGKGYVTIKYNNLKITIMQMIGKVFMDQSNNCPFKAAQTILDTVDSDIYICDFHGEATSEKISFGYHFDGKINVIYGTHTHVATKDARILPNGSAYVTDIGMTGALNGVIGTKKEIIIDRLINDSKMRFEPEDNGPTQFNALIIEINELSHKVTKIDHLSIVE